MFVRGASFKPYLEIFFRRVNIFAVCFSASLISGIRDSESSNPCEQILKSVGKTVWDAGSSVFKLSENQQAFILEIQQMDLQKAKTFLENTMTDQDQDNDFHKAKVAALLQRIFSLQGDNFFLEFDPVNQPGVRILDSSTRLGRLSRLIEKFYGLNLSYRPYFLLDDTLAFAVEGEGISLSHTSALGEALDPTVPHEIQHLELFERLSAPPINSEFDILNAHLIRGPNFESHGYDRLAFTEFSTWWGDLVRELRRHEIIRSSEVFDHQDLVNSRQNILGISETLRDFSKSVKDYLKVVENRESLMPQDWKMAEGYFEIETSDVYIKVKPIHQVGERARVVVTLSSHGDSKWFLGMLREAQNGAREVLNQASPNSPMEALHRAVMRRTKLKKPSRLELILEGDSIEKLLEETRSGEISDESHKALMELVERKIGETNRVMDSIERLSNKIDLALRQTRPSRDLAGRLFDQIFGGEQLNVNALMTEALNLRSDLGLSHQEDFDALMAQWDPIFERHRALKRFDFIFEMLKEPLSLLGEAAADDRVSELVEGIEKAHQKALDKFLEISGRDLMLSPESRQQLNFEITKDLERLGFSAEQARQIVDAKLVGNFSF
jgi:hypothetical protein